MNIRFPGAIFVLVGCAAMGFSAASNYKKRIAVIKSFLSLLENMITEVSCNVTPLPELCRSIAQSGSCFHGVMLSFSEALDMQVGPSPLSCMEIVLRKYPDPFPEYKIILLELAEVLGKYDLSGQIRQLENLYDTWSKTLKSLEADVTVKLRYFRVLGLCAGAALAIILV